MCSLFHYLLVFFLSNVHSDTIDCSGDGACSNTLVTCVSGEACTVNCDGDGACQRLTIECPSKQDCNVNCIGGASGCRYAVIKATDSSALWLSGCGSASYQCYSMEIYCPPQRGGVAKCHITGGDAPRNFDFWNLNGFNDLDASEYSGSCYGCGIGSYMKCEHDYSSQCLVSDSEWSCDPSQPPTICNNPPTYSVGQVSTGLSPGSIFIIVLLSLFVSYCVVGTVYQGKKNQKWVIPNYSLWRALPSLFLAGCKVTIEYLQNLRARSDNDSLMKDTDIEL